MCDWVSQFIRMTDGLHPEHRMSAFEGKPTRQMSVVLLWLLLVKILLHQIQLPVRGCFTHSSIRFVTRVTHCARRYLLPLLYSVSSMHCPRLCSNRLCSLMDKYFVWWALTAHLDITLIPRSNVLALFLSSHALTLPMWSYRCQGTSSSVYLEYPSFTYLSTSEIHSCRLVAW
jgi:hypothetical protein